MHVCDAARTEGTLPDLPAESPDVGRPVYVIPLARLHRMADEDLVRPANIDEALKNLLKRYFPDEVKAKQRSNARIQEIEHGYESRCAVM